VEQALQIRDQRVLITTYTESNEAEIRQKFFDVVGHVPANVVIMTWFSLLITHGVMPFQGTVFDFPVKAWSWSRPSQAFATLTARASECPGPTMTSQPLLRPAEADLLR
jgi:DNA helicase-2/ATP-dependent DNA helicase PcrA